MRGVKVVKWAVIGIAVSGLVLGGAYGVLAATAETDSQYPPLVERIAKAFNLNPAKVFDVFQEVREERMADRDAIIEERLDQLVADGKITKAQKDAILEKIKEIRDKIQSLKDNTPEQRRAEMQNLRSDLQAWAKENGLDNVRGIPGLKLGKPWRVFRGDRPGIGGCGLDRCGEMGCIDGPQMLNGLSGGENSGSDTTSNGTTL